MKRKENISPLAPDVQGISLKQTTKLTKINIHAVIRAHMISMIPEQTFEKVCVSAGPQAKGPP